VKKQYNQANPTNLKEGSKDSSLPAKRVFELSGPCGKLFAQARTPDQARGVYLAKFPHLPRNLESISITSETSKPKAPYSVIQSKGKYPKVIERFP